MVMGAIRLAGITPTKGGFDIAPHLPFGGFLLRLPKIGIASDAARYRGYIRPAGPGPMALAVHLPAAAGSHVTAWAGTRQVPVTVEDGVARFEIPGRPGRASDWAVSW
jgi:hypothetical protein